MQDNRISCFFHSGMSIRRTFRVVCACRSPSKSFFCINVLPNSLTLHSELSASSILLAWISLSPRESDLFSLPHRLISRCARTLSSNYCPFSQMFLSAIGDPRHCQYKSFLQTSHGFYLSRQHDYKWAEARHSDFVVASRLSSSVELWSWSKNSFSRALFPSVLGHIH